MDYKLIDSGNGEKLERFGKYTLARPCSQAIWPKSKEKQSAWDQADASFNRKQGLNWTGRDRLPKEWTIAINGIQMKVSTTDFGHIGIFPETISLWQMIQEKIQEAQTKSKKPFQFLNLFAYSGGATMAAAQAGAHCCHVDASKGMVQWARDNAQLNQLDSHPIRWIVDDVNKFLTREIRRGRQYDGILLDPPSFGRGRSGELYKIEYALVETLENVKQVFNSERGFVLLTSHTPGFTPTVLSNLLKKTFLFGNISQGEMLLLGNELNSLTIPSGTWSCIA
tara:strand:+ start:2759 stop:3601 length:843 start_codon:yes stop_codon:yes gene_type:complete